MTDEHLWWQRGIIYQVYPRSFMDSDGDGVGDLKGITRKLDYLAWLGVDAVWISPIYPSPMADFGYDISDYRGIHPLFGTMEDFDALLEAAHDRGLKIILDFVPNHTSAEHPWFEQSRSSAENPKRDWYVWEDPAPDGGPPNNWRSILGTSAWEWDADTEQYYYHAFLPQQPDLNWRNPEVRKAMFNVMRFWLDKGVDGFRVDVIWHLIEDEQLRDNPVNPDFDPERMAPHKQVLAKYSTDRPAVHDVIADMRALLDEYDERMMVGEIYLPVDRIVHYYGRNGNGVHLPFNFMLIEQPWDARTLGRAVDAYEAMLPTDAWPNWVLGNHDKSRIASRVGEAQARVAAMMLLTLRGTPTIYYGDELGMRDRPIPPDRVRDPWAERGRERGLGRDPQRTPMQWNAAERAGFTEGEPWLPLADDSAERNVATEREDPQSMLTLHRRLIELRSREPAFEIGEYAPINTEGDLLAYVRKHGYRRFLVVLNLGAEPVVFEPEIYGLLGEVTLSTHLDRAGERANDRIELRGDEGVIVDVTE